MQYYAHYEESFQSGLGVFICVVWHYLQQYTCQSDLTNGLNFTVFTARCKMNLYCPLAKRLVKVYILPATQYITIVFWLVSEANLPATCIFNKHLDGGQCWFCALPHTTTSHCCKNYKNGLALILSQLNIIFKIPLQYFLKAVTKPWNMINSRLK